MKTQEESFNIQQELEHQYQRLLDRNTSLDSRLEAFDFIADSEVGDTPLIRARNIERELGIRQIYLKFEGGNPTGTHKDRIAFAQCHDAIRRGFDGICLATCGNYGLACALAAKYAGLSCTIFMPEQFHSKKVEEMTELGATVKKVKGDYEKAVNDSQEYAERHELYDANPGGDNTPLQLKAYGEIAYEIYDELRDAPKIMAVPVSNGTVLAGLYKGFVSLYRRGKTSRVPHLVGGSSYRKNPIIASYLQGKVVCEDLPPQSIKETEVNEPLINWHSFDGDITLNAIYSSKGWAADVTDKKMMQLSKLLKDKEGLQVLPAATAGLAALMSPPDPELVMNDRFVVLITARK
jgi:threonine synthase